MSERPLLSQHVKSHSSGSAGPLESAIARSPSAALPAGAVNRQHCRSEPTGSATRKTVDAQLLSSVSESVILMNNRSTPPAAFRNAVLQARSLPPLPTRTKTGDDGDRYSTIGGAGGRGNYNCPSYVEFAGTRDPDFPLMHEYSYPVVYAVQSKKEWEKRDSTGGDSASSQVALVQGLVKEYLVASDVDRQHR